MTKKGFIGLTIGFGLTLVAQAVINITNEMNRREKEKTDIFSAMTKLMGYHADEIEKATARTGVYEGIGELMVSRYVKFHTDQALLIADVMLEEKPWQAVITALVDFHISQTMLAKIPGYFMAHPDFENKFTAINREIFAQYGVNIDELTSKE